MGPRLKGEGQGGASWKLTHWLAQVVPWLAELRQESWEAWRVSLAGARGQGGVGRASAAAEPFQELHASRVCRDCRRDERI